MLLRLAQVLEQLDLALEHLSKGDANNARFGLMLTDNALELSLHRLAQEESQRHRRYNWMKSETYPHRRALEAALGQDFSPKLKFAELSGRLTEEEAGTIRICHLFRNETYHVGVRHEEILPEVSRFYFKVACDVLERLSPLGLGWSSGQKIPERAKKYFAEREKGGVPAKFGDYEAACRQMAEQAGHDPASLAETLANHMANVINDVDVAVNRRGKLTP